MTSERFSHRTPPEKRVRTDESGTRTAAAAEHRHVESLPTVLQAVRTATESTEALLVSWGFRPRSSVVDAACLVVAELVLNVVRHAENTRVVHLILDKDADGLLIAVHDGDDRPLPVGAPGPPAGGLGTVRELALEFGGSITVEPGGLAGGKAVRVRLAL